MYRQIVTTKLFIPSSRPSLVPRQRLLDLLETGRERKLTLVSAGAGFGKSTLVSTWADPLPNVAWVSLDEGDSDLIRFLTYIVAAVQTVAADFGGAMREALGAPQPLPLAGLMTMFVNELAELKTAVILILDDYHTLNNADIDQALLFLVDHAPPQLHLVLLTREDPPLPLARLRVRQQLTEIRTAHLRFTLPEAVDFFNQVMGLTLSSDDVAALEDRTEGWVAGLQLAALSLQERGGSADLIDAFSGAHHLVRDYLLAEVIGQQSAEVQHFLRKTAVFDQLNGSFCDAILDLPAGKGQAILQQLQQANLFVVPLDDEHNWYRYHHLLRDYLRTQLNDVDEVARLRRQAARWYGENGRLAQAIENGLQAKEWPWVLAQLEPLSGKLWAYPDVAQFRDWCLRIPSDHLIAAPTVHLFFVWGQLTLGDLVTVRQHLPQLENTAEEVQDPEWLGLLAIIRANQMAERDPLAAITLYEEAHTLLPVASVARRGGAFISFGLTLLRLDDLERALSAFEQAIIHCETAGNVPGVVFSLYHLGETQRRLGRLDDALSAYERGLALATKPDGSLLLMAAWSLLGKGQILWEQQHRGLSSIIKAVQMGKQSNDHKLIVTGLLLLARVQMGNQRADEAWELWRRAQELAQTSQMQSLLGAAQQVKQALEAAATTVGNGQQSHPTARQVLIEPLSQTEKTLLQMVAQGYTNRQIATQRTVTLNTVKWHLKNIYGKLNVSNRTGAVAEGRKLGLL